jgi:hypothetical protein
MGRMLKRMRVAGDSHAAAERKVLDWLVRRWRLELPNGELPEGMDRVVRAHPQFQKWVSEYRQHQTLTHPDLAITGRHAKRHTENGVVEVDLLVDELGADPREFVCDECEADVPRGQGVCLPCRDWLTKGE